MELLVAMGIVMILYSIGILAFGSLQKESSLDLVSSQIKTTIYKAQAQTINGIDSGVYFDQGRYVFFEGPEFVEGKSQNWEENLPESLQIISINLPSQQVLFSKISGYVSNYVSPMDLTLLEPSTGKTRIISINKLGVVEIQ